MISPKTQVRIANALNRAIERLSTFEQRVVYSAIASVSVNAKITSDTILRVHARDLVALGTSAGDVYRAMTHAAESLRNRQLTIREAEIDGFLWDSLTFGMISAVAYKSGEATIGVAFDSRVIPFISDIQNDLTFFQLHDITGFRSQYTAPVYRMLMQFMHEKDGDIVVKSKGWCNIEIKELCTRLELPEYRLADLKKNVLDVVTRQINEAPLTKFKVSYELNKNTKEGRKYKDIMFKMWRRPPRKIVENTPVEELKELTPKAKAYIADVLSGIASYTYDEKTFSPSAFISWLYRYNVVSSGHFVGMNHAQVSKEYRALLDKSDFRQKIRTVLGGWGLAV